MALPKINPTPTLTEHSNRVSWIAEPQPRCTAARHAGTLRAKPSKEPSLGEAATDAKINVAVRNLRDLIGAATAGIPVYYAAQPPRRNEDAACSSTSGDGLRILGRRVDALAPTSPRLSC